MGDASGAIFTLFGSVGSVIVLVRLTFVYQRYVESKLIQRNQTLEQENAAKDATITRLKTEIEKKDEALHDAVMRSTDLNYEVARLRRQNAELQGEEPKQIRTRRTDPTPELPPVED